MTIEDRLAEFWDALRGLPEAELHSIGLGAYGLAQGIDLTRAERTFWSAYGDLTVAASVANKLALEQFELDVDEHGIGAIVDPDKPHHVGYDGSCSNL